MKLSVLLSFVFLGFVFYEMSGGGDFDPTETREKIVADRMAKEAEPPGQDVRVAQSVTAEKTTPNEAVTRVSLSLASFDDIVGAVEDEPKQAPILPQDELVQDTSVILPSIIFSGSTTASASAQVRGSADIRAVARNSVNLRGGPGTNFNVVTQLNEGAQVEVLDDPGNGWVQLRPLDGGPVGWMADFLLTGG